jgi:hypothetical protein
MLARPRPQEKGEPFCAYRPEVKGGDLSAAARDIRLDKLVDVVWICPG